MILICLVLSLVAVIPFFFIPKEKQNFSLKIIFTLVPFLLVITSLCSFYLTRSLFFLGALIIFFFEGVLILTSLIYLIYTLFKNKNFKNLLYIPLLGVSVLLSFLIINSDISEKMALKIEFPSLQKQLDEAVKYNLANEKIYRYDDYTGIVWDPGFLDSYSVIIYDKNNNLDLLQKASEDSFPDKEMFKKYKETFKYEKIVNVLKIKDCYFRCNILE